MIVKISRYILVLSAIVGFSMVLPQLYWMAFSEPDKPAFIMYSCIKNDFMIIDRDADAMQWRDTKGNSYPRNEFEKNLPLFYYRQLMLANTMPDSINGVAMDMHSINYNRTIFSISPNELDAPVAELYPLFEAESGRANIEMPDDFFRIGWRMEFIDAKTNKILEEKSRMFSAVLYKRGFEFPAKSINGIPTPQKSIDEGYLVTDSKNQLFHIKMLQGKPYVVKVNLPSGLKFKAISCQDFRNKRFYAYLFSTSNELYILTQDEYELIKFPVSGIDPQKYKIRILGDLFHYNISITSNDFIKVYAVDSDYNYVDEYQEFRHPANNAKAAKVFKALFPWQIKLKDENSTYIRFFSRFNSSFYWIILSTILVATQIFIVKKRKARLKNNFIDFLAIGISGIFGFLAVNIFPNKFYD